MSYFWQNIEIFTCIQICYYDWPSFNKWFVIVNIGHVFGTGMSQGHIAQCSGMEISAYCWWPDLSWPLCDHCRNLSDLWPCFLPRKVFQTVQDSSFGGQIPHLYPTSVIFLWLCESIVFWLWISSVQWKNHWQNKGKNWSCCQSCNIRETLLLEE